MQAPSAGNFYLAGRMGRPCQMRCAATNEVVVGRQGLHAVLQVRARVVMVMVETATVTSVSRQLWLRLIPAAVAVGTLAGVLT
jgi:hypothetical protein